MALALLVAVEPAGSSGVLRSGAGGGARSARRGVLRIGVTPIGSLDPAQARSLEQTLVADQLFDSLTAYDPATLAPVPSLAARWDASPDQRVWTFRLRSGAAFANGRPVIAEDVKYSLERVARRGSGSPGAELLQLVEGYAAFRTGEPSIAGIATPAPGQVRITLAEPLAELASVLASPVLAVVPREAVEAGTPAPPFTEAPVGSGPFRLAERDGPVLRLERAPGGRVPEGGVRRVEVVQYGDQRSAYRAFARGDLDWARVPPDSLDEARRRYGAGAFRPYVAELFFGFNLQSPKLADARLREAVVRAVDRRALVAAIYQGMVAPADGLVVEGVPGHQDGACGRCGHDPARALALLAELYPGGAGKPELAIDYDAGPSQEAVARAIQAGLAEVGLPVTLRSHPVEAYDEFAVSGQQEIFRLGWIAAYPSPDAFLTPLLRTGSPNNLMGFSNPAVDERLRAARAEPDPERRLALYREAERAALDQLPVIPVAQFQLHAVVAGAGAGPGHHQPRHLRRGVGDPRRRPVTGGLRAVAAARPAPGPAPGLGYSDRPPGRRRAGPSEWRNRQTR